jgi:hypothetical protein
LAIIIFINWRSFVTNKIVFLAAAAGGIALATSASVLSLNSLRSNTSVDQVRLVCDEYGRCWRETNPGEDIARGVLRGLEGRSIYRHRDWYHRRWHRDWDEDDEDDEDED